MKSNRPYKSARGLMQSKSLWSLLGSMLVVFVASGAIAESQNAIVKSEFIFETAPFPSCHASTIAETRDGLVAAWFGGKEESASDVAIWVSRHVDGKWSEPQKVASGTGTDGKPVACWNPVLFQQP